MTVALILAKLDADGHTGYSWRVYRSSTGAKILLIDGLSFIDGAVAMLHAAGLQTAIVWAGWPGEQQHKRVVVSGFIEAADVQ